MLIPQQGSGLWTQRRAHKGEHTAGGTSQSIPQDVCFILITVFRQEFLFIKQSNDCRKPEQTRATAGDGSREGSRDIPGSAVCLVRSSEAPLSLQFKSRLQSSPAPSVARANTEKIPLGLLDCPAEQKPRPIVACEEQKG